MEIRNIHRKTPVLEVQIQIRLKHRCFPRNIEKFLRTALLYKISGVNKKATLKKFAKATGRHRAGVFFSIKLKETPTQVCLCELLLFYITPVNDCFEKFQTDLENP